MLLAGVAVVLFVAASVRDLGWRLIDDRLVLCLLLAWGGHAVLAGWSAAALGGHLAVGVVAFVVAIGLGLAGWMGGGDVKLAAATFLWAGPSHGVAVLALVALAGLVLAVAGMAADFGRRRLLAAGAAPAFVVPALAVLSAERGVPYGVALAFGGAVAALAAAGG